MNNRQGGGGRRRGRGGQRPQGMGGGGGNARDNRQRGNAAQLLEKYKNMARDAQLAGDRVQTEYYLQFADHYFRVLGENRSRYEDQRQSRDEDDGDDEDDLIDDGGEDEGERAERPARPERFERRERAERGDRPERGDRAERPRRERFDRRPARDDADDINPARAEAPLGIADFLPPAIGPVGDDEPADAPEANAEEAPRPRRRTRRPRVEEGGEDIAPAA